MLVLDIVLLLPSAVILMVSFYRLNATTVRLVIARSIFPGISVFSQNFQSNLFGYGGTRIEAIISMNPRSLQTTIWRTFNDERYCFRISKLRRIFPAAKCGESMAFFNDKMPQEKVSLLIGTIFSIFSSEETNSTFAAHASFLRYMKFFSIFYRRSSVDAIAIHRVAVCLKL